MDILGASLFCFRYRQLPLRTDRRSDFVEEKTSVVAMGGDPGFFRYLFDLFPHSWNFLVDAVLRYRAACPSGSDVECSRASLGSAGRYLALADSEGPTCVYTSIRSRRTMKMRLLDNEARIPNLRQRFRSRDASDPNEFGVGNLFCAQDDKPGL